MRSYVCAFRGRRDSYQVPLALAEVGRLDQLITDAYAQPWLRASVRFLPGKLRAKVNFRSEPGLPADLVRCLWGTTLLEHARHRAGFAPMATFARLDRRFSEAAARRAAQTRSDLFLYSSYAWEAFTARYPHTPRKVLFQYHPHPGLVGRLLAEDSARFPGVGESFSGARAGEFPETDERHDHDAWEHADLIFCASSFTKRSLLEAGAEEKKCRVVPYGMEAVPGTDSGPPGDAFRVLYVGSGSQRKGLHHLLLAWRRAALPATSRLTLVCRALDREIERLVAATPRVELRGGVPAAQLHGLYAASSLFVMPSLVEGFGQVYLEALARGCPVLGTTQTGLPDLGAEADGIFLAPPGDLDALAAQLERLARALPAQPEIRHAARACAGRFTWPVFREQLRRNLEA